MRDISRTFVCLAVVLVAVAGTASAQGTLLATDQAGNLWRIDITTAAAAPVLASVVPGSTELEADPANPSTLYFEGSDGDPNLYVVDGCGLRTVLTHSYGALNGLEFVGGSLYGAFIPASGAPSTLVTVNLATGVETPIGPTQFGPISGLAYNTSTTTMYGVTAGGAPAQLLTINLGTGVATLVAPILDAAGAPVIRIGSIEWGPDGNLYGGLTGTGTPWPSGLIRINTTTGVATLIGSTGVSITGLTSDGFNPFDCASVPTTTNWGRIALIVLVAGVGIFLLARRFTT